MIAIAGVRGGKADTPAAEEILAGATAYEDRQAKQPLEQVLAVKLDSPEGRREGTLSVWAHVDTGRFVSRWTDDEGVLRHAVWRDKTDKVYVYDASAGPEVSERSVRGLNFSVADIARKGLSGEQLERGFMRWIESRSWRTISLARGLMRLASDGFALEVKELPSEVSGQRALRVTGRKQASGRSVELYLEVQAHTYRPINEVIRITDSTGVVEFSITPRRTLSLTASRLKRVFTREWVQETVFGRELQIPPPGKRQRPPRVVREVAARSAAPSESELLATELEIRYALHRSGACLGEPVRVSRDASGQIAVSGLVENADRRQQLVAALEEVEGAERVKIDIRTVRELEESRAASTKTRRIVVGSDDAGARIEVKARQQAPLEEALFRYHQERGLSAREAAEEAIRVSNHCVALAETILAEAWALRRLAERYDFQGTRDLPSRGRWLLEVMLGDHMRSISSYRAELDSALGAPIGWLAGPQPYDVPAPAEEKDADWERRGVRVFDSVAELHRLVLASLAGGSRADAADPKEAVSALARTLAVTGQELQALDGQLALEFPGNPRRLSSHAPIRGGSIP